MIYFIQPARGGPVKIGWTEASVAQRVRDLQVGNPEELYLRHWMAGDRYVEKDLHVRFADWRLRGEWFIPNEDMAREFSVRLDTDDGPDERTKGAEIAYRQGSDEGYEQGWNDALEKASRQLQKMLFVEDDPRLDPVVQRIRADLYGGRSVAKVASEQE